MEKSAVLREWQEKLDSVEDEHRRKILDKDSKIRGLENDLREREF